MKRKYFLLVSIIIIIVAFLYRNKIKTEHKKTDQTNSIPTPLITPPMISNEKHSHADEHEHENIEDKIQNHKPNEENKDPSNDRKKVQRKQRIPTKEEKKLTKLFSQRNPHLAGSTIEITNHLKKKGKTIAIVTKGEISYSAEIDTKTGKIERTWGKTQYEYRKDMEKLHYKIPKADK